MRDGALPRQAADNLPVTPWPTREMQGDCGALANCLFACEPRPLPSFPQWDRRSTELSSPYQQHVFRFRWTSIRKEQGQAPRKNAVGESATGPSGDQWAKGAGSVELSDQALTSKLSYWKHVFAVVMQPCMMATAQPADFQRLVVVIVMRINRFDAANLTALLVEFA
jgi:hypothetical protein